MIPTSIVLSNYRSFGGPETTLLELRPITLLFGRNGSGKSALLRSLPLIADSLVPPHDQFDAFNLGERLERFNLDFESLRWKGRDEGDERTIRLGLRWENDPILRGIEWNILEHDDWNRLVVDNLYVDAEPTFAAKWLLTKREKVESALSYTVQRGENPTHGERLEFRGLMPPVLDNTLLYSELAKRLRAFSSSILWLHSLRPAPERSTNWRGAIRWSLRPDGQDAPLVLWEDSAVLQEVSSFYEAHMNLELRVDKEPRKKAVRTYVRNRSRTGLDIDLIDTGEGLSECLSVLTAMAMVRRHGERGGPSILAVEEPGSHLHPDLQEGLIERACEVVTKPEGNVKPRIVLETHSEIALLAVQRAIVNGTLAPEDAIFYWVDQNPTTGRSSVEKIVCDRSGRLQGNWPPDAFQKDLEIAADVQDARDALEGRQ